MLKKLNDRSIVKIVALICVILFGISLVLNGLNIFVFYRNFYLSKMDEEAEGRLEEIKGELNALPARDWLIDYWKTHLYDMDLPKNREDELSGEWHKAHSGLEISVMESFSDEEMQKESDEEVKRLFAEVVYVRMANEFYKYKQQNQYYEWPQDSCMFIEPDTQRSFFLFGGVAHEDENGNYEYVPEPIDEDIAADASDSFNLLDKEPNLARLLDEGREGMARDTLHVGSLLMMGAIEYSMPLYDDDGKLLCVLTEEKVLADYFKQLAYGCIRVELANAVIHLLILLAIIYVLNIAVVRSTVSLKNAVRDYSDDKDTKQFVDKLEPMAAHKNEIGVLASDVSSMALEIRRYMDEMLVLTEEKGHLEGQLAMAVKLKSHLMPNVFPAFPEDDRLDIYADQIAMEQIGGDYYDFFTIDSDHIAIVMADIFDGGTVSALFMVAFKVILTQVASYDLPPAKTMQAVNNLLYVDNEDDLTLSAWFGVYECSTGRIRAVNAGHETPLLVSPEGVREVEEDVHSFIIGMVKGMVYQEYSFTLKPGERMLLYTDGVLDITNGNGESFGRDRLVEAVDGARTVSAGHAGAEAASDPPPITREVAAVQDAVFAFAGEEDLQEDITLLCLERKE